VQASELVMEFQDMQIHYSGEDFSPGAVEEVVVSETGIMQQD